MNFLGIKTDSKLTIQPEVESLCERASKKVNALSKIVF